MGTEHILSTTQVDAMSADELNDLVVRLGRARSRLHSGNIADMLVRVLAREGVEDAERLELSTWDWDNGYFPYFGEVTVVTRSGERVEIEIEDDGDDPGLAELITAEAVACGLGERSRITVEVSSGSVDVN